MASFVQSIEGTINRGILLIQNTGADGQPDVRLLLDRNFPWVADPEQSGGDLLYNDTVTPLPERQKFAQSIIVS